MKLRKSYLLWGGFFTLVFLLAVFMLVEADNTARASTTNAVNAEAPTLNSSAITPALVKAVQPTVAANSKLSRAKGVKAIAAQSGSVSTNATTNGAKFTEADVRKFLHDHPEWGQFKSMKAFNIDKVEFITADQVKAETGRDVANLIGVPGSSLFCLVVVDGSFSMDGGPQVPGQALGNAKIFQHAFQLFDAQTGNLVLMGGLDN